jgi:hypothetical protein
MASITPDDAMILRDRANPRGWNFRERQGRIVNLVEEIAGEYES